MTDDATRFRPDDHDFECDVGSGASDRISRQGGCGCQQQGSMVAALTELANAIRDLIAKMPVSSDELLTAEQLGDLFRLSPRTLRDLAASGLIRHHRIGKHYRFSCDDIAEILRQTRQELKNHRALIRAACWLKERTVMAYGEPSNGGWRARYKRPDGTWGSQSGFTSEKAAEDWGAEQEALIRRNMWIDPRDAGTLCGDFFEEYYVAIKPRLTEGTAAKYRSHLDTHIVPQWSAWPLIAIFNSHVEIVKWVSELHEDYSESTVASIFATFSTFLNAAVRERIIPASPCGGIRVTSGEYVTERLVASPIQALRAAMRLYEAGLGLSGFTLCLADFYTGARWGELGGQQRHEYDELKKAIGILAPLKEVGGTLKKYRSLAEAAIPALPPRRRRGAAARKGRTKTPAGTRWVELPPSIAVFYELLLDSHRYAFAFVTPEGHPWRRSNFRQRYWRPAWDGVHPDDPNAEDHRPAILPWFTFHEGRHSHSTWLTEDGVPEVARRARLGQKMKGIAQIYDHVTDAMKQQIIEALEARWAASLLALTATERAQLTGWFPHLVPVITKLMVENSGGKGDAIAISSPFDH